jgi:predicted membrane-bound spermidine synthase
VGRVKVKKSTVYYLIFALSGFSGLIYESIWTHYLKLFLGHAAYAQTLVLAIFMGGMALGAAICSRYSGRWHNLLRGYALAEGVIGLCALLYHPLFDACINYAYATIIPALTSQLQITVFKWGVSTASILPQSILLGMTFPLMSGAFLRLFPQRSGASLATLYFANSMGAVFGGLASGFVFIGLVGFPGTIGLAGIINIVLAVTVWFLSRDISAAAIPDLAPTPAATPATPPSPRLCGVLLLVSLATGTASFIYEVGWIRMLALVLGSSTHAFELMLGAFLLGLATGGLWIKRRIDSLVNPVRSLAVIQLCMGLAALATLPLYNGTFPVMQFLVHTLPKTETGYLLFNLSSYGIAAAIMLPATFCAGMTLPLLTNILFRAGHGEKSVGAVYAANTVGAIIGIFGAIHLLMPHIGLKGLLASGATLDMTLAVLLLAFATDRATRRQAPAFAAISVAAVSLVLLAVHFDYYMMASGVYRTSKQQLLTRENTSLLFYKDGKTSTVSVTETGKGLVSIRNNGKSDSYINLDVNGPFASDEPTLILMGALPFLHNPQARTIANIGLGTGLTTQTILSNPLVSHVDTIEIERAVVEGAHQFRQRTELVYTDPRSRILVDDAKSVFSSTGKTYDIIISEPSNPWVSGVSSLFSDEFYRHVRRYLRDDGLFVQWIQLYEMDMNLVASVFKALAKNFTDYTVYLTAANSDIMVVAKKKGSLGTLRKDVMQYPSFRTMLSRISVNGLQDIHIREIGSKKYLDPLFQSAAIPANSDYFPVLDQRAAKARYLNTGAFSLLRLACGPIPYLRLLSELPASSPLSSASVVEGCDMTHLARRGASLRDYILTGRFPESAAADSRIVSEDVRATASGVRTMLQDCGSVSEPARKELLSTAAIAMVPYLTQEELQPVWNALENSSCRSLLSATEKGYLDFFKALSARNFPAVAAMARQLLSQDRQMPQHTSLYFVGTGMLASIASGNGPDAADLYRQVFATQPPPDIIFRLLAAKADVKMPPRGLP